MKNTFNSATATPVVITLICGMFLVASKSRVYAINGLEGTFEFACDAPWRIEPHRQSDGSVQYGAIPIQVSIHDAMHTALDNVFYAEVAFQHVPINLPTTLVSPGNFHSVRIRELGPVERPPI